MALHTINDLKQRQALPLEIKIRMTQQRIREWVSEYGTDGVYVSFSGGKDSTVLLHIVRKMYPDIPAVFLDTGLEYPEIREFVKTFDNVVWLKPEVNFKQVINTYGYPFISKEVSNCVDGARKYLDVLADKENAEVSDDANIPYASNMADILGIARRREAKDNPEWLALRSGEISNYRVLRLLGELKDKEGKPSKFNQTKYAFFLNAPFKISDKCCNVMKKRPAHKYERETGRKPIIATMAEESYLRTQKWLAEGCNAFDGKNPHSKPMSFWRNQDVLRYIKDNNLPIASVYGDIVEEVPEENANHQIKLWECDTKTKEVNLITTGCKRTGCMYCAFGCHLNNDQRFVSMKETHPKQYDYIMRPESEGGLNYKEVIDWINEHGNLNIKY